MQRESTNFAHRPRKADEAAASTMLQSNGCGARGSLRERMARHKVSQAGRGNVARGADLRKQHRAAQVGTTHPDRGSPRNVQVSGSNPEGGSTQDQVRCPLTWSFVLNY
jgi:hypothetical protein